MNSLEMDFTSKMNLSSKIDFGLTKGIHNHWKQELLVDYTIVVEEQEFKVHKLVLASVSDYFQAMICGSLKESVAERVELKGLSADAVSKLIDLIYSGQYDIVTKNTTEILECAVYFQIPEVIAECRKVLLDGLTVVTCGRLLAMCQLYSFDEEVQKVKSFIEYHLHEVVEGCKHEEMPREGVQQVIDSWGLRKPDWELFCFIKYWLHADYENRKVDLDGLMSQVRFCLIEAGKLAAIKEMDVFTHSDGSWRELVEKAEQYHRLPTHCKLLNGSQQAQLRGDPVPVYIAKATRGPGSWLYYKRGPWVSSPLKPILEYQKVKPVVLELNNFLFTCTGHDKHQVWHIFNPRDMSWANMDGMLSPKTEFALVHHDDKLYALGGHTGSRNHIQSLTDGVEVYDLRTGAWSVSGEMPTAVAKHAACVYDGCIYVSGGMRESKGQYGGSADLECLNTTTNTWQKKAAMSKEVYDHKMHVMTLNGLKVVVVIDQGFNITYYHPPTDHWATFTPVFSPGDTYEYEWCDESVLLAKGNTVFLINICGSDIRRCRYNGYYDDCGCNDCREDYPDDDGYSYRQRFRDCVHRDDRSDSWSDASDDSTHKEARISLVWSFSENGNSISEKSGQKCSLPGRTDEPAKDFFAVLLLVPWYRT